jgi:RNA polymerase sigma factor (sigma-70 family)
MVDVPNQLGETIRKIAARLRPASDAELLRLVREQQDHAAFAEIVERHGPMVMGVCRRALGQRGEADDVFQATFLTLFKTISRIRKPECLSTWLYRTAWNIACKVRAKKRPIPSPEALEQAYDPYAGVEWAELRSALDEELNRLPQRVRSAMVLCYLEGMTREAAAEHLQISKRTLMRLLEHGRATLKERLERRGLLAVPLALTVLEGANLSAQVPAALLMQTAGLSMRQAAPNVVNLVPSAFSLVKSISAMAACVIGVSTVIMMSGAGESQEKRSKTAPVVEPDKVVEANKNDVDGPLPEGALRRFGTCAYRNGEPFFFGNVSFDGRWLVSGSTNVDLWDLRDGSRRKIRDLAHNTVPRPTISPDGKTIAVVDGGAGIHIHDAASGKEVHWLGRERMVDVLRFARDGKTLLCETYTKVPEKPRVPYNKEPKIVVFDVVEGKTLSETAVSDKIRWLPGNLESSQIVGIESRNGTAHFIVFDPSKGKGVKEQKLPNFFHREDPGFGLERPTTCAVNPSADTAAFLDNEHNLVLYSLEHNKQLHAFKLPRVANTEFENYPMNCLFTPDERFLVVMDSMGGIYRCDLKTHRLDTVAPPNMLANYFYIFAIADDSRTLILGGGNGVIERTDLLTGKPIGDSQGYGRDLHAGLSQDGKWLVMNEEFGKMDILEAATGKLARRFDRRINDELKEKEPFPRNHFAYSPDGKTVALSLGSWIILWDLANQREIKRIVNSGFRMANQSYGISNMFYSPNGKLLLTAATFGKCRVFNVETGGKLWETEDHNTGTNNFDRWAGFAHDNKSIIRHNFFWEGETHRHSLIRQDAATGAVLHTAIVVDGPAARSVDISSARMSPDRRFIALSSHGGSMRIHDAFSLEKMAVFNETSKSVSAFDISPNGLNIALVDKSGFLRVLDTFTGKELFSYDTPDKFANSVQFNRDGSRIVTASSYGLAYLWDARIKAVGQEGWPELKSDNPKTAYRALNALAANKNAVALLRDAVAQLPEPPALNPAQLIEQLDSPRFAVRENASKLLRDAGRRVERALEKAMEGDLSAESRERISKTLAKRAIIPNLEERRLLLAVTALEWVGTADAKKLLKEWSTMPKLTWIAGEAASALGRMEYSP